MHHALRMPTVSVILGIVMILSIAAAPVQANLLSNLLSAPLRLQWEDVPSDVPPSDPEYPPE